MTEPFNILIIEDRNADFMMVESYLKLNRLSVRCSRVDSLEALKEAFDRGRWDLVLADYNVPRLNFMESLHLIQATFPDLPVIMVTGAVGEEKAVELLKLGVRDFVLKENLARLVPAIELSLKDAADRRDRMAAVEALRQNEEMYRSLFDNMLNGFAYCRMIFDGVTPLDFIYLKVNEAFEKQTGLKCVVGKRVTEVIPGIREADPRLFEIYGRVALTGNPEQFEMYVEALEQWYWLSVYSPAREHFVAVFDVITERKLVEKALFESEERFKLALQGANAGLWDWDLKTDRVYYSPRWKSMLGYDKEELENCYDTWERLLHPEDMEPTLIRLHDFIEGRATKYEVEFRMRHKEGRYVNILVNAFLITGDQGEALRMVGTHVDVTEHKKLEEQYRQAQKMEAIGQLAGGVAHDFNNILSVIFGYSQLSLDKLEENDTVKYYVEQIMKASERAAGLTQSLLTFSRKQTVTLAVIDPCRMVKEFEVFLRRLIREDVELMINCTGEPLTVMADRGQIEQVIMNLVANSRDAMPSGGRLTIETLPVTMDQEFVETHGYGKAGAYAMISVSDSGVGMDNQTQSHIFEPFYTTKEQGKGTGLGLSMAYGIIKKHDGFINVYSEPGKGTTFNIYLPNVRTIAAQAGEVGAKEAASLRGGAETILVCEDDAELRTLATNVLSNFGYRVIEAVDGQDAIEKFVANKEKIDLVFIDAIMPKKNGKLASDEMKTECPDLKTIFVSGYSRDIFEENETFDEKTIFIHKPYSPHELVTKVKEMLDKK